jgi:hypothetical protein
MRRREDLYGVEGLEFVFFWGHRAPAGGGVGPSCMSQWWPASFAVDGVEYATAEHFMMAEKARLFGDPAMADRVVAAEGPQEAKALGREVSGFDADVWKAHRFEIVVRGNLAKFSQNPPLAEYLAGTGDAVIVEASPRDTIWGIGLGADNPRARQPEQWRGLNLLGFALMEVRSRLAREPAHRDEPAL